MKDLAESIGTVLGAVVVLIFAGLVAGLVVFGVWHLFSLQDLVHINFWQAIGIGVLLAASK